MSSYPALNKRPIDQLRVTDLKGELRKRRLPVKGLKEELVRRLFDSIQSEQASSNATEDVGLNAADDRQPDVNVTQETTVTSAEVRQETTVRVSQQVEFPGSEVGQESMISAIEGPPTVDVEASLSEAAAAEGEMPESNAGEKLAFQEVQPHMENTAVPVLENNTSDVCTNKTIIANDELSTDVKSDLTAPEVMSDVIEASKIQNQDSAPAPVDAFTSDADPMDTDVTASPVRNDGEKLVPNNGLGSSINDEEGKISKLLNEDRELILSKPNNQAPEVSPDLGSQIECESISSDDISTNKKNNIEDNLNANNFDLELEVKPKMVESSSGITSLGGDLQPEDDDKELTRNQSSLEEDATDIVDSSKKDSPEGGSPEKLILDRSSGDESMEEDVMESKQAESNIKSDGLKGTTDVSSKDVNEMTFPDSAVEASPVDTKEVIAEEKPTALAEKRKLEAEEVVANTEPIKRQRRWTGESGKVPERQTLSQTVSEAPKDVFQPALKRVFGRSDTTASGDSPKEWIVLPSQKPATTSLRIDRFVRPFTLKAVQELLGKTGSVQNFWMDHIKTHCYVTFSSVDEAVATRNAVYNLQWPPNNGNHLVAEFVDPQEVKLKLEPSPPPAAPISPATAFMAPTAQPAQANPSAQHQSASPKEQLPPPLPLARPPTSDPVSAGERLPPTPKKPEPPVVTLDDLFRKTQASPRIYYLPLSEEEVAAKRAEQGKGKTE